jgi:hypothetical protein
MTRAFEIAEKCKTTEDQAFSKNRRIAGRRVSSIGARAPRLAMHIESFVYLIIGASQSCQLLKNLRRVKGTSWN